MSPAMYYIGTTVIMLVLVGGAIGIKDPEVVFELGSGLSASILCFLLPGYLYLSASKQYDGHTTFHYVSAIVMIVAGALFFLVVTGFSMRMFFRA